MVKLKHIIFTLFGIGIFIASCNKAQEVVNYVELGEKTIGNAALDIVHNQVDYVLIIVLVLLGVIIIGAFFYLFTKVIPLGLWWKAQLSKVRLPLHRLLLMYWRGIPQEPIITSMITAKNAGIDLSIKELEDAYLAKVDIKKVIDMLIKAYNSHIDTSFQELRKYYLAGVDLDVLIEAMIIAKSADIETTLEELATLYHTQADIIRIVKAKVAAKNSGYNVEFNDLAEHYLAGGNIEKTVEAYVAAKTAGLKDFDFQDIANIDLAGYDVFDIVEKAIIPRVVEGDRVRGVARDGVELSMKVRVTLRAKLKHIIGSPEEKTILARINEGLATEIGLAESHYHVLENPYELADRVEQKRLDEGTAFEVLSIDVSDIEIGKDVHAELETERARAEAEAARASLIKAEEKVQKAIAAAFLDGQISVELYEKLKNLQADTKMRESIGKIFNEEGNDENEEEKENEENQE